MYRTHSKLFAVALLTATLIAPYSAMAQYDDYDSEPVATHTNNTARQQIRITELEEQLRKLQGSLEQVSFQNKQLRTQMDKMKGDMEYRLNALEKGGAAAPAPAQSGDTGSNSPQASDNTESATPNKYQPSAPEAPAASDQKFNSSHEHYSAAFKLLNQAKYAEAGALFGGFTQKYPKDPLIGNAYYWLGETQYIRKDYVTAADSFRQGYEAMPTGPKAPDNLIKLASALSAQKKEKDSCLVLKQVSSKFGKTSPNIRARVETEMNRINCR